MTTRRAILAGIGLAPVAALPAVAAESSKERIERLTTELAAALADMHGGRWSTQVDYDLGMVAIIGGARDARPVLHRRVQGGITVDRWEEAGS